MRPDIAALDVVISTFNEERNLPRLFGSLRENGIVPEQVAIVDKGSHDGTAAIAFAYGATVRSGGRNSSEQRNIGARIGRRAYLVFLDADMELVPGQVQEWLTLLAGSRSIVIPERSVPSDRLGRGRALERRYLDGDVSIVAARIYERGLFEAAGGYASQMYGCEDWVLATAARAIDEPAYARTPLLHHDGRLTSASLFEKYRRYGSGYFTLLRHDRGGFVQHANPLRGRVLRGIVREGLSDPSLFLAWLQFRVVTYVAGAIGFVEAAVRSRTSR